MSWLSSSICKTGIKILTLLIGLCFRLVIPALQTALKNHQAAKITCKQRCTYSAHPLKYHFFPLKSFIPCSHILGSLRGDNGLMVKVIRHLFWNNPMKCKAMHTLINKMIKVRIRLWYEQPVVIKTTLSFLALWFLCYVDIAVILVIISDVYCMSNRCLALAKLLNMYYLI